MPRQQVENPHQVANIASQTRDRQRCAVYPRGSEWRKWDLHVHTPGTAKNDQYESDGDVWADFVNELENQADVAVFGITDYWSVDNWKKLLDEQRMQGRLAGKLLVPNAELRIIPVTQSSTPINIHVLFDPELPYDVIQREFFQQLNFESRGCRFSATKDDLIALGRHIRGDQLLEQDAAWKLGIGQFQVSYADLRHVVESSFWRKHCIVCVDNGRNDGASGIQESAMRESRCEIYRMAGIVFSASGADRKYFLGQSTDTPSEVVRQYGSLKPCVSGSDAHDFQRLKEWHAGSVTWIKADPTFDGLRQILFEPDERVRIQDVMPGQKAAYQILDSIVLNEDGFWSQTIQLNQDLVAIIGGRSSGKSTLLEGLARKICLDNGREDQASDFVKEHLSHIEYKWADGDVGGDRQVEYFPQNYMIEMVNQQDRIDLLVEELLKSDPHRAMKYTEYEQRIIELRTKINADCTELFVQRETLSSIIGMVKEKGGREGHVKEIESLEKQMVVLKRRHLNLSDDENLKFDEIRNKVIDLGKTIQCLKDDCDALMLLRKKKPEELIPPFNERAFSTKLGEELRLKHSEIWGAAFSTWIESVDKVEERLNSELKRQEEALIALRGSDLYKRGVANIEANAQLKAMEDRINDEKSKLEEVDRLLKQKKDIEDENVVVRKRIVENHLEFKILADELARKMSVNIGELTIRGTAISKTQELRGLLEGRMRRKRDDQQELVNDMVEHGAFGADQIAAYLQAIMAGSVQYNQDVNEQYVVSEFLSANWFKIAYEVVYQSDDIRSMSPGKRAFVVLMLLLDFSNKGCPILIDQPEDSLDNRAIYSDLVRYLRKKKHQRQIILVTHNPNVVVGADAEQVIVANQRGAKNGNVANLKFSYKTGALENSMAKNERCETVLESQGIREHVCEILEGGEIAFKKREDKYGLTYHEQ